MNVIDKIIRFISPNLALKRAQALTAIDVLEERKFDAASGGPRTKEWNATATSPNTEIGPVMDRLRSRSRDMYQNNGHLRSAINRLSTNIIGVGIRPSIEGASGAMEKKLLKLWKAWAERESADWDGRIDFYGIQALVIRTVIMSGECIIRRRRGDGKSSPLIQIQVHEADFLDYSKDGITNSDGSYITLGVEFSKEGKRIAYWLYDDHPGGSMRMGRADSRRIPANDVCHIYWVERPGQTRGIPWTVASMLKLRDLNQYEDAQIIRQKVAACFTAFVQDMSADNSILGDDEIEYDRLEPGRIEELPAGKTIQFATPPAAEGFDIFTKGVLRSAASGIGITYEAMTNDYSNVNFSSGRMGWIEMGRQIQEWQMSVVKPFNNTVWGWFMEAMTLAGQVRGNQDGIYASWTPPRREMLDPVKESEGIAAQLSAGIMSYSEAIRKNGYDPDDVIAEMSSDIAKLDAAGLVATWDGRLAKMKVEKTKNTTDGKNPASGTQD